MTQRILLEFDALDKYSQDVLAKHAKKRTLSYLHGLHSVQIPLIFDSRLDNDQDTDGKSASSKQPLETAAPAALSLRNKTFPDYAKPLLRPFTAAADRSLQKGCASATERKSKKVDKPRCVSATRWRNWQSEVELVTKLGTLCTQENNPPILGLQDVSFVSPRSPPPMVGSPSVTMETKHHFRQSDTNMDRVSLSIDDELMKSDVKVITAREKTCGACIETVMDAKPATYQKENTVVFFSTLADLQKHVPAKQSHFPSSRWPADSVRSTMGASSAPLNNTNHTKDLIYNKRTKSPPKSNKRLLSANMKLNIQFLSEDGTKKKVILVRQEKTPREKQIRFREINRNLQESQPWPKPVLAWEERDELGQVGTVKNGINPKKTADRDLGVHSRPQQVSKASRSSSARTPTAAARPSSVVKMQRWSYITISKPLSPPGHQQDFLEIGHLVPFVASQPLTNTPRSGRRCKDSIKTLTTRPLILKTRRGRQNSAPVEIYPQEAEIPTLLDEEDPREDNKKTEEGDNVSPHIINPLPSSIVPGNPEIKSPLQESSDEQAKKSPLFTVPHMTIPIISIPTAQTDTSE